MKCVPGTEGTDVLWNEMTDDPRDKVASVPWEEVKSVSGGEKTGVLGTR